MNDGIGENRGTAFLLLRQMSRPIRSDRDPPKLPFIRCSRCGSMWFREVGVNIIKAQTAADFQLVWWDCLPDVGKRLNYIQARIRVCLCGAPFPPALGGGFLGGRTANMEMSSLMQVFGVLKGSLQLVSEAARLRQIEGQVLRRLRRQSPELVKGLRKPWKPIGREPEAPHGRDKQVLALQQKGFKYRMARLIVDAIMQACVEGLKRDERLETPLGLFQVVLAPAARQAVRFGKQVTLYRNKRRVKFTVDKAIRADRALPEVNKRSKSMDDTVRCPKCGSEWLMQGEFRRYREAYSAYPGGEIDPVDGAVFRLAVCLCGHPLLPSRVRRTAADGLMDFVAAVQAAQEYRAAATAEVEQLRERIREVEVQLRTAPPRKSSRPSQ